ncbi:MAG: serine/threonine protein kinase [Deltaproteobacteria bacterium]|nr:serine/threonine protein kinase [Deltaproteobacteria bacterium]
MKEPLHHPRYSFISSLGEGGQANTYRGRDDDTGQEVAIKVLTLRGSQWKRFDLFERECDVLRGLDHPGIPEFLDTFADEDQGKYALVMELLAGENLNTWLVRRKVFSEEAIWRLLDQALEILHYLHSRLPPVIHRDIKPANLILSEEDELALVDFGGVRVALRPEGGSTVVGTFGYMAPEQLYGEALPTTDIYGLGATFAALTCGVEADKLPRKGLKIDLEQLLTAGPLRDVLHGMLEPNPAERLRDSEAVRAAIKQAHRVALAVPALSTPAPIYPPTDKDSAATILLGVFGTLGYMGLLAVEVVLWPLIFTLLSLGLSRRPDRLNALQRASNRLRRQLRQGQMAMKSLAEGRPHGETPKRLPPNRAQHRLPPPNSKSPSSDPHRPRPRGYGSRGHRGGRQGSRPRRHGRRRR